MLQRPMFKPDVKASLAQTGTGKVIMDLLPDTSRRVRLFFRPGDNGTLFFHVMQHFGVKKAGRNTAYACLNNHGQDDSGCPTCALADVLKDQDDVELQKVGKRITASPRWYVQVRERDVALLKQKSDLEKVEKQAIVAFKAASDQAEAELRQADLTAVQSNLAILRAKPAYGSPKILGLSKTTAGKVNDILGQQDADGDDLFADIEAGQDLVLKREGAGLKSRYTATPTGRKENLDVTLPGWEKDFIEDIQKAIALNVLSREEMLAGLRESFDGVFEVDELLGAGVNE